MNKLLFPIVILISGCRLLQPGAGDVRVSEMDGMEMVFVPAGEFEMGSAANDPRADEDESPLHRVHLDAFWIDRTEVTNTMYNLCIDESACTSPARTQYYLQPGYADHPIIGVSWEQAQAYCSWAGRRLPSEAEWEKAARGIDGRIYPWGNESPSAPSSNFNHHKNETEPVGSHPDGASPYGALDMAGNAWEWVLDGYSPDYYSISPGENPISDSPVNRRVLRGGNWDSNAEGVRSANRFWAFPGRNDTDGFRCAKSH
jgi:formylglycine-generating enzyme required for sulfatase activity